MRSLRARLAKLEASPALGTAGFCPGCWVIRWVERYSDEPDPPDEPCPVCNGENAPTDGGVRTIVVVKPRSAQEECTEGREGPAIVRQ